ncbi:MAG: phenylalanine--tRNA ligase subunit beta, partial [Inquilinus sp.]|nr:phenylalanine--tRNA ligase subunit beta [Inquilinus sp.]
MKFTLSWLKEHLDTDRGLEEIAERLTALGLEVDGIEDKTAALAPFTVGHVVRCEQHPNANRLKICHVHTGAGETQVVCGAPNARAGMKGVFAPAGTYIPGTDMTLKPGVIRGVESNGMLCSEREMGLSDEHTGIIELPEDAPVGAPFARIMGLDDPLIDIALTPDRGDCAGVRGIARDLAAAGIGDLRDLAVDPVAGRFKSPIDVKLTLPKGAQIACPLFVGRYVRGLKNRPSPRWLQDKLRAVGLRPISTLVDITNYFTLDRDRPLHVFDADTVAGGLHVRLSKAGETLDALNDKSYTLDDQVCVIADDDGVLALGGVIGGQSSGCTGDTENVFVECALFDPLRTAASGRKLAIDSDARYRFERGVDPDAVIAGMEQATRLIVELCGGEPSELVVAGAVPGWRRTLSLRPARVEHLGGVAVPLDEQVRILTALGCTVAECKDGNLRVEVPSWRSDIHGEAELGEEVLRVHGFDNIPAVSMPRLGALTRPAITVKQRASTQVRRLLD